MLGVYVQRGPTALHPVLGFRGLFCVVWEDGSGPYSIRSLREKVFEQLVMEHQGVLVALCWSGMSGFAACWTLAVN